MDLEQLEKLGVDFSKEAFAKSRALDRELKQERKDAERYVRLLMLGTVVCRHFGIQAAS
jgi:hypothetical protein